MRGEFRKRSTSRRCSRLTVVIGRTEQGRPCAMRAGFLGSCARGAVDAGTPVVLGGFGRAGLGSSRSGRGKTAGARRSTAWGGWKVDGRRPLTGVHLKEVQEFPAVVPSTYAARLCVMLYSVIRSPYSVLFAYNVVATLPRMIGSSFQKADQTLGSPGLILQFGPREEMALCIPKAAVDR